MNLAIRIQNTPKRQRWANSLRMWLCRPRQVQIITDTENDLWGSAVHTLTSYGPEYTHVMVLQDDVLPCRDLAKTAERLIELYPKEPITLFSNKPSILDARTRGLNFVLLKKFLMAQAYIMPVSIIEDFIPWATKHIDPKIYFDDNRWAMYLFYHGIKTRATAPSLVEHIGWNDTTITYNPGHNFEPRLRMAAWFIGFENSGLDVDWSKSEAFEDTAGNMADFSHYYIS